MRSLPTIIIATLLAGFAVGGGDLFNKYSPAPSSAAQQRDLPQTPASRVVAINNIKRDVKESIMNGALGLGSPAGPSKASASPAPLVKADTGKAGPKAKPNPLLNKKLIRLPPQTTRENKFSVNNVRPVIPTGFREHRGKDVPVYEIKKEADFQLSGKPKASGEGKQPPKPSQPQKAEVKDNRELFDNPFDVPGYDKETQGEEFQIVWDVGRIKHLLTARSMQATFSFIKSQLVLSNSIIKHYIRVRTVPTDIEVGPGKVCGFQFPKGHTYKAHLVVLVNLMPESSVQSEEDEMTIARAGYCRRDEKNRAIIGVMDINLARVIDANESDYKKLNYLLTFVHEILHVISFSDPIEFILSQNPAAARPNLKMVVGGKESVWLPTFHWAEAWMPNELMTEVSRPSRVLSIFSLEIIESISAAYLTNKKYLANNYFMDQIASYKEMMKYRCGDNDKESKYPYFCSAAMEREDNRSCSPDFLWKSFCTDTLMGNNCYARTAYKEGFCLDPAPHKDAYAFEHFGSDSRCFNNPKLLEAYCLRFKIENGLVAFWLDGKRYECPQSGEQIKVKRAVEDNPGKVEVITVECPDFGAFQKSVAKTSCPNYCSGKGFCSDGRCICFGGYAGDDCKIAKFVGDEKTIFTEMTGK